MTATAIDILNSIDNLPEPEQHQLVLALLRRVSPVEISELMDDELILCAESIRQIDSEIGRINGTRNGRD